MYRTIFRSFRFEIILYALLSMIFTILTEGAVIGVGYLILKTLSGSPKAELTGNNLSAVNMLSEGVEVHAKEPVSQGFLLLGGAILIIAALGLFITYFLMLTKKFSTYLEEIAKGIRRLSAGDFDSGIEVKNDNELTDIAINLNKMAQKIKNQMDDERKVETKKNALITNVAHDLRTPLTSIIGYLELVSADNLDAETEKKYISVAYSKSKRLERLIDDLFTYTKLDFGEIKPMLAELDAVKLLEQLIEEFYPSFQENNIEYKFITKEKNIFMMADGGLLSRAFANLLSNAVKYGSDGKNIIIQAEKKEETLWVRITNFGEIIPKEALENVFNKFYRVDNSRNTTTGGSGLGLTIAKNIVRMHGGMIQVKSDLNGTVFEVCLPLTQISLQ